MILLFAGGIILERQERENGFLVTNIGVLGGVVGRESDVESVGLSLVGFASFKLSVAIIRFYDYSTEAY